MYELCKELFTHQYADDNDPRHQALHAAYVILPNDGNGVAVGGDMAQIAPGHTYMNDQAIDCPHLMDV